MRYICDLYIYVVILLELYHPDITMQMLISKSDFTVNHIDKPKIYPVNMISA